MSDSPGRRFRSAVTTNAPLPVVGTINAYSALLAQAAGHRALYLSGGGVANASFGLPDLGMTSLHDVLTDASRITSATDLPLLVDIDTGFGGALGIGRTIREMEKARVAAVHIEDQVQQKRCGHRPNKEIVSQSEMVDRIKAAVDARRDPDFVIMARTDAVAAEGMEAALERLVACVEAGADMVFPEALSTLDQYHAVTDMIDVPVLANITEFGKTPLFNQTELGNVGVGMVLYPLSAFRAMNRAAMDVYRHINMFGDQRELVDRMQSRDDLYDILNYHDYEQKLDDLFGSGGEHHG